ncbi:HEPN domain-containing protein [Methanobacterium alcaliphilum]|uniref:HEPN domain-containing protein n=1 Tax=Methanobacterium alcaliphilum TaxID=392018 RepID=UPI00200ACF9A|nr:HEPN domain-containing protein [Methanobacterium alcaliphilum]MCK9151550.1 HEPN domain-containing protein [Methanobacterium alcaliphilum]
MFNIAKTKEYLWEICKSDEIVDNEFLKNKMLTYWYRNGIAIYLDAKNIKSLRNAINEVRKDETVKFNFLEKHVEDKLKDIISNCHKLPLNERSNLIDNELELFRSELKKEINEWVFWIPIDNLNLLTDNPFSVGNVKFFRLDHTKAEEITEKIKISNTNDERFKTHINNHYINPNIDKIFAEVKVRGVKKYARENGMNQIRMAINVLRLYAHSNQNFGIRGEITPRFYRKSFEFTADYEKKVFPNELIGSVKEFLLNDNLIEFMKNNGFDRLDLMLKTRKPTFFETRILTAIYWFGEAMGTEIFEKEIYEQKKKHHENLEYFKIGEKYIKLSTALESILTFEQYEPIKLNIAERTAFIIGKNYRQRKIIINILKELYDVRSNITHNGYVFVSKSDLQELIYVFRNVIIALLELDKKYKFKSKESITDFFDRLKLKCTSDW